MAFPLRQVFRFRANGIKSPESSSDSLRIIFRFPSNVAGCREKLGDSSKNIGAFSKNVGVFSKNVGDNLENVGAFWRIVGEKQGRNDGYCGKLFARSIKRKASLAHRSGRRISEGRSVGSGGNYTSIGFYSSIEIYTSMLYHPCQEPPGLACCTCGRSCHSPEKPCGSGKPYHGSQQMKGAGWLVGAHTSQAGAEDTTRAKRCSLSSST